MGKGGIFTKKEDINIRDPFVVKEAGKFYLYGTRAKNFGQGVGGFDVYVSGDMENWSEPIECFNSEKHNLNTAVNWAPEVHKYKGTYYMFATFTKPNGLRGTYALKSNNLQGPFVPHSEGALTPFEWEALDGTLYVAKDGTPYLVFCHEHTQIIDGTICYIKLSEDLRCSVGKPVTLFSASSPSFAAKNPEWNHFVTDGPFMYRSKSGELFMIWSTFINKLYSVCLVKFENGELGTEFEHLPPLITDDGGHGMTFNDGNKLWLTFHTPNRTDYERPVFIELRDNGDSLSLVK